MSIKYSLFVIIIMILFMGSSLAGSTVPTSISDRDLSHEEVPAGNGKLNRDLITRMNEWNDEKEVSLIVRYRDEGYMENTIRLREMGFEEYARFHVVPALGVTGRSDSIRNLVECPWIEWIENDTRVELMMETSLRTINATKVWDARVKDNGVYHYGDQIDGSGITVVVLDTGIDADHPDMDYGDKTIFNLKCNTPGGPWHERRNTDTSYGHGTHCAGTVAGNGDASAGARRGVAPGANLIGLSVGDIGITLTNVLGGLEWVYDNSKPHNNQHNIRVISNSWGTSGRKWDPGDTISQVCYKLAVENNVVNIFAAGNDGSNNHDGSQLTTSPYANTPINIAVAALERDGSGVASFSSRGESSLIETWPDVGAPGVKIWSAHARKTAISALSKLGGENPNPYYLAISGTSMATPHVSGLAALMFQACPSLGMSESREDHSGTEDYGDIEWDTAPETRIHEIEEVLEYSTLFLETGEGVPEMDTAYYGMNGRSIDFAQGYGLVKCDIAVGICLTLDKMRERYPDKNISVGDAYEVFRDGGVLHEEEEDVFSEEFTASWEGEYSRWNDITQTGLMDTQNQTKYIYIPNTTTRVRFVMTYQVTSLDDGGLQAGDLSYVIDVGPDGRNNYVGTFGLNMQGHKELNVAVGEDKVGKLWKIDIVGRGLKVPLTSFSPDRSYVEIRVEYDASVTISGESDGNDTAPFPLISNWDEPFMANYYPLEPDARPNSPDAAPSKTTVFVFDLDKADFPVAPKITEKERMNWWPYILLGAAVVGLSTAGLIYRKKRAQKKKTDDH